MDLNKTAESANQELPIIIRKPLEKSKFVDWYFRTDAKISTTKPYERFRDSAISVSRTLYAGAVRTWRHGEADLDHEQYGFLKPNWKLQYHLKRYVQKPLTEPVADFDGTEPYNYKALPANRYVRLLRLHRGSPPSAIGCSLEAFPLDDAPAYEALSYNWGQGITHQIQCDGFTLTVQENLWLALSRLRYQDASRFLWIDAVCIDQSNLAEKTLQLQLMQTIYECADRVVVWLGEESSDSYLAFDAIFRMVACAAKERLWWPQHTTQPFDASLLVAAGLPRFDDPAWMALDGLLWRPYFTRAWIVQEITLTSDAIVVCGPHHCLWKDLVIAATYIMGHSLSALTRTDPYLILKLYRFSRQYHQKSFPTFLHVLAEARNTNATNPRDKTFAFLGLCPTKDRNLIETSYESRTAEVYASLASNSIALYGNLNILNVVEDRRSRKDFYMQCDKRKLQERGLLPHWAPDWEIHRTARPLLLHPMYSSWSAGGSPSVDNPYRTEGNLLSVQGYIVDLVDHSGITFVDAIPASGSVVQPMNEVQLGGRLQPWAAAFGTSLVDTSAEKHVRQWEALVKKVKAYPGQPESALPDGTKADIESASDGGKDFENELDPMVAYMRTLIGDAHLLPDWGTVPEPVLRDIYGAWRKFFLLSTQGGQGTFIPYAYQQGSLHERMMINLYMEAQVTTAYGRRLFTTKKGYIGLGSSMTAIDSRVVVLRGGKTPFILEKAKKGAPSPWSFGGECYVHGLMHGEALAMNIPEQEFVIH